MTKLPEHDGDGVEARDTSAEIHENTRSSEDGVEKAPVSTQGEPATGLIGAGKGVDPRYVSQR